MPGQWMQKAGMAGLRPLALLCAGLVLTACISDQQAVDMGLATKCDGTTTFAALGDPANRYLRGDRAEICKGAARDAGNRTQLVVLDCATRSQLTATVAQAMANPARHGPDFDLRGASEAQLLRLKLGFTDFNGLQQGLQAAGIPTSVQTGTGAENCIKAGAVAPAAN